MTINVVHSRVVALFVLIGKHNVLRQLPAEACRLIHIIPYAAYAFIYKELLILAPPVTHFFFAKIRINRISRPYCIDIDLTLRRRCKIAVLHTFVVNRISLFQLYTRINDGYDLDAVLRQICDHLFRIRITFLIWCPGKYLVVIHIIDIQMNGIAGDSALSHVGNNIPDFFLRHIAPAALMIAQGPLLRNRNRTCQISIIAKHLRHTLAGDQIIIQIAVCSTIPVIFLRFLAHIKAGSVGVIIEQAKHCIFM